MNQSEVSPSSPEAQMPGASSTTSMERATLKSFMAMGGTRQCEFTDTETGSSGQVYLDSGKMRGDFSSNVNGKVTPSHMINDGESVYVWMDDQPTGFKTTLAAIEAVSGTTGVSQSVDVNKEVNIKCENWNAEADKFTLPQDKTFNDMSKMMQDVTKMMQSAKPSASLSPEVSEQACAACENLEGQAKTQCRSALKCP